MVAARSGWPQCDQRESTPVYLSHNQSHLRGIGVRRRDDCIVKSETVNNEKIRHPSSLNGREPNPKQQTSIYFQPP